MNSILWFVCGVALMGALWYFWPTVHADLKQLEKDVGAKAKAEADKKL